MTAWNIMQGDVLDRLSDLEDESIQTCVTSPPYWGLRDYGTAEWEGGDVDCDHSRSPGGSGRPEDGPNLGHSVNQSPMHGDCIHCGAKRVDSQLGLEATPEQYVEHMVAVFREVRRVLRADGTVWLNLGDSYAGGGGGNYGSGLSVSAHQTHPTGSKDKPGTPAGLKAKDLVGIPWRVAFALRADGWWLRSDVIWNKPAPMPESITDRPTKAHEYIFLLAKSSRYYYDADAIREPALDRPIYPETVNGYSDQSGRNDGGRHRGGMGFGHHEGGRNKRSVWTVSTQAYADAHFATFPPKLIEPCILAGAAPKACGQCGAPWKRLTERIKLVLSEPDVPISERRADDANDGRTRLSGTQVVEPGFRTLGWESTCGHTVVDAEDVETPDGSGHSVVLDPFAGSGTTGLVSLRLDRSFIGIELNPEYCEMARDRIRNDAPLLNTQIEHDVPIATQQALDV